MIEANSHRPQPYWESEFRAFNRLHANPTKHVRARTLFKERMLDARLQMWVDHVNQWRLLIVVIKRVQQRFLQYYYRPRTGHGFLDLCKRTLYRPLSTCSLKRQKKKRCIYEKKRLQDVFDVEALERYENDHGTNKTVMTVVSKKQRKDST